MMEPIEPQKQSQGNLEKEGYSNSRRPLLATPEGYPTGSTTDSGERYEDNAMAWKIPVEHA